jgi:hypothetical protein
LRFIGTVPVSPVVVLVSRWELPRGIPVEWGPGPRARVAEAVRRHHARDLGGPPVYSSLGVAGVTMLPIEVEPGACYLAAMATIRGDSLGMAMAGEIGNQRVQDNPGAGGSGTAVAFCAGDEEHAVFEIETRGVGLVWLLGLWQTTRVPIGEVAE